MWGAHFYAFFPHIVLYVSTLGVAVFTACLALGRQRIAQVVDRLPVHALSRRQFSLIASATAAATMVLFWKFRICHTYLGDGNVIVGEIDNPQHILPREPLTGILQYAVYGITKPWFYTSARDIRDVAQDAVAVGSVVAGFLFLAAMWLLADELVRLRPEAERKGDAAIVVLVWLCLAAQGYMQLFFGYVENYSFYAVGVMVFMWLCLRCLRGACSLAWPALSLCLGFALHLSSSVLTVPFVIVVIALFADPRRRRGAIRDLAIVMACAGAVLLVLARRGFTPLSTVLGMTHTAFADGHNAGYMFSGRHYRDFFNEQILIGPLGMFLFLAGAGTLIARRRIRAVELFFVAAGGAFAAACWMIGDSNLGYARDWDLLSHAGIVFTISGFGFFLVRGTRASSLIAGLLVAVVISLYHTVPWVLTNTNEARSLARLETLPLGLGRTEMVVASWYEHRGDEAHEREWLERSIAAFPNNANSYYMRGVLDLGQDDYPGAIVSFEDAVAARLDKVYYRVALSRACFMGGQPARAVPHLRMIASHDPANMTVALFLGEALYQSGQHAEAQSVFDNARCVCRGIIDQTSPDALVLATYGWVLYRLGDHQDSLDALYASVDANPRCPEAQSYLGCVLRDAGRDYEAREHFEQCLAFNPGFPAEIPNRAGVIAWMSEPVAAGR